MCGIVGYSGLFDQSQLNACLHALAHRGPDDSGKFVDESAGIGLGHTRLSILDISSLGHQPMLSDSQHVGLVYNGEIYNFRELRKELEIRGHSFKSHSDTEVLLTLYLDQGESMLSRLNGIFSIALWDSRKEELLVARDGLGIKPFYYSITSQGFAFASEIKALLPLLPEPGGLDIPAIHRYLSYLWCPGDNTPFKSVKKLLPGQAMVIKNGAIKRHWDWYHLPGFDYTPEDLSQHDWVSETTSHLRTAVHRQLIADVPVGAFLSGGLDSSAVVAFARERHPDIHCFTIEMNGGQEAGSTDDLPYAREVAKHLGVKLDVVSIEAARMAQDLESMVVQLDEPLADPAPLNVLYISRLARQNGIKVLLSGAGGDDLFTGYRRHYALELERFWRWMPCRVRKVLESTTARLDMRQAWGRRLAKLFNGASLEGDERIAKFFQWSRESDLMSLYTPEFKAELQGISAAQPLVDFLASASPSLSPLDRMLLLEQRFFLADHNLNYTDKMSMAASVEARVPFLDLDLVSFAARIPKKFKQRGSEGKWVLKKAMEPYLPHDVIYRPKTGFGAPLRRWMKHDLKELLSDILSESSLKRRELFDPTAVQKMIAANDKGQIDASYTLFSILCIEIWCRGFLDQKL